MIGYLLHKIYYSDNMDSQLHYETQKVWDWVPCTYDVKRVTSESETIWNLSPSIQLSIPDESLSIQPLVNMRIEMSRNFIYTENIGWNWHKSWNMPDMVCELDVMNNVQYHRFETLRRMIDWLLLSMCMPSYR